MVTATVARILVTNQSDLQNLQYIYTVHTCVEEELSITHMYIPFSINQHGDTQEHT